MEDNVIFEYSFGMDTEGEIRLENSLYQCYSTPLYGGSFMKVGKPFEDKEEAIEYLKSLT